MKAVKELPPKRSGVLSVFNVNEPTPKMKEIRNDGKMGIVFNNKITFPDNFLEIIQNNRLRCLEDSEVPPLIEIIPESGDTESTVSQAIDWEITSVGEKNIDFKLVYSKPLEVSQGAVPDKVKVRLNLSQFTDEYGQPMADGTEMEVEVPRQIPDENEAASIEESG